MCIARVYVWEQRKNGPTTEGKNVTVSLVFRWRMLISVSCHQRKLVPIQGFLFGNTF